MRTLFFTLLLASLIGGALHTMHFNGTPSGTVAKESSEGEYDPCSADFTILCGRLRVPGG